MSNYEEFLRELNRNAYHEGEVSWDEDGFTVTRSNHWSPPGCHNSCGLLLYVKDGKLARIEGDPLNPFVNGKLCMRCLNLAESCNHPDRIKYPMIRAGERGENKWKRISWDEALDIIEEKVRYYQKTYGNEAVSIAHGTGRNVGWPLPILAYLAFETPTVCTQHFTGFSCYLPRVLSAQAAAGDYFICDAAVGHEKRYADPDWQAPKVIIVWGNDPLKSNADGYIGHWLVECIQLGSKLISIDPRLTWWGAHADIFLQLRPGTDAAVAMAMLNVIITEDLYDHDFVENWCHGFDELEESVKNSSVQWAAKTCDLNVDDILEAARLFATAGTGTIQWGLPFEQQFSCMGLNTAAMDLMAICGNIDVPGGMVIMRNAFNLPNRLSESYLDPEINARRIIQPKEGFPWGDTREMMWASEADAPSAQKMLWIQSTNPLACPAMDAPRAYDIIMEHEFVVVADPYLTPTASACADMLLPVAMSPERNSIRSWWTPLRSQRKAYDFYEARSDEWIVLNVGKRLNPGNFPWETDRDMINWRLAGQDASGISGADRGGKGQNKTGDDFKLFDTMYNISDESFEGTLDDLDAAGCYAYDKWNGVYKKYEKGMLRADKKNGFNTPTGKFELVSYTYASWNMCPTPYHLEPYQSPISTPVLFEKYPLILLTGGRSYEFFHSENRQEQTMREFHPWPLLQISQGTADEFGVKEGEWAWVENDLGRFKQVVKITTILKDGVIHAEHGWWFPEQNADAPNLFGTFDSNPNNCIPQDVTGPYGIAAPVKNMLVTIYPYKEGDVLPGAQVCELGGFALQNARRKEYLEARKNHTPWPKAEDLQY